MPIPFLDLKQQAAQIRPEVDAAVGRVVSSGWYILGPEVEAFEREFADYIGAAHGIGVGSGTEALHLALLALGVGPDDEVITVPNTAVATVAAIALAGARPVLVDVDPVSMTLDPACLEAAITPRSRAVIPVHLYGRPADLDPIIAIARRHGLAVLEDCAQAHGAVYRDRRAGAFGDMAAFSFYPTKNLGAYGDAGMILTGDAALAERARLLRQYGWRKRYESELPGLNSRLDEVQAAILRVKLRHLDGWNAARRERAGLYARLLPGEVMPPQEAPHAASVYHLYVIQAAQRDDLAVHLRAEGVETAIHYPVPIHLQPAYRGLGAPGAFPVAEDLARRILSLPLYPELPLDAVRQVAGLVSAWAARCYNDGAPQQLR